MNWKLTPFQVDLQIIQEFWKLTSIIDNLSVCWQLGTSPQLWDKGRQVGLDWDTHVTQVLNLFGGRVIELEEDHDIDVIVEVWYSDLRSFWICRFKEDGPLSDRVGPWVEVIGHVNQGPIQIGFRDQQGWPQCLWKMNIYYSSNCYI